eukprot:448136-Rhodomonas_salina.1
MLRIDLLRALLGDTARRPTAALMHVLERAAHRHELGVRAAVVVPQLETLPDARADHCAARMVLRPWQVRIVVLDASRTELPALTLYTHRLTSRRPTMMHQKRTQQSTRLKRARCSPQPSLVLGTACWRLAPRCTGQRCL